MKFIISRNGTKETTKPCDEAILENLKLTLLEYRRIETQKEAEEFIKDAPAELGGTNYRYYRNLKKVVFDTVIKSKNWTVDFDDLSAMLAFKRKYGAVIIEHTGFVEIEFKITIEDNLSFYEDEYYI